MKLYQFLKLKLIEITVVGNIFIEIIKLKLNLLV